MLETLINRRSIRKYTDQKIEENKIQELTQAALLSPTSKNKQSWEFIIVQNTETLHKLSQAKEHGAAFLKDAPLAFVVLGDSSISDVWVEDTSIASIILQLTAEQMGLGSCWIQIRNRNHNETTSAEKYIQNLLNIPEHLKVEAIISMGYPAEKREPHKLEDLPYNKIKKDKY